MHWFYILPVISVLLDWLKVARLSDQEKDLESVKIRWISGPLDTRRDAQRLGCGNPGSGAVADADVPGLIQAINDADSYSDSNGVPGYVYLAAGSTYTLTTYENPSSGNNGLPRINHEVVVCGNGATITRNSATEFRIFKVNISAASLTLDNVTLSNGHASGTTEGGAVYVQGGDLRVLNNSVLDGNTGKRGGAIHEDFRQLLGLLTIHPDKVDVMKELALQSEYGDISGRNEQDLEAQKIAAIAKYKRRVEAAKNLYLDGELPREEYLSRKKEAEQQIAHWEARTSEVEKAAIELQMCVNTLDQLTLVWDHGTEEDKQAISRRAFEAIYYDLDLRRIVGFRMAPWAERYLVLRAALYEGDAVEDIKRRYATFKHSTVLCPIGAYGAQNGANLLPTGLHFALYLYIELLRRISPPDPRLTRKERDITIRARYEAGEATQADLAREFGVTYQRIHQIINEQRFHQSL